MWFTIAFFSIPMGTFLLYRGLKDYGKKRKTKIFCATLLVLIPIIFAVIEIGNKKQINQELVGTYYSANDTLVLNKDQTFTLKSIDTLVIGRWELETNDKLIVTLDSEGKKFIDIGLTYIDGLPYLDTDPYHIGNISRKRYGKK